MASTSDVPVTRLAQENHTAMICPWCCVTTVTWDSLAEGACEGFTMAESPVIIARLLTLKRHTVSTEKTLQPSKPECNPTHGRCSRQRALSEAARHHVNLYDTNRTILSPWVSVIHLRSLGAGTGWAPGRAASAGSCARWRTARPPRPAMTAFPSHQTGRPAPSWSPNL